MCDVANGGRFCPFPLPHPLLLRSTLFFRTRSVALSTLHLVGNPCLSRRSAGHCIDVDPPLDLDVATCPKTQRQSSRQRNSLLELNLSNFMATNNLHLPRFYAICISDILSNEIYKSIATLVQHRTTTDGLGIDAKCEWAATSARCLPDLDGRVSALCWNKIDFGPTSRGQFDALNMAIDIGAYFTGDHLRDAKVTTSRMDDSCDRSDQFLVACFF